MFKKLFIFLLLVIIFSCERIDVLKVVNDKIFFPDITYCSIEDEQYVNDLQPTINIKFSQNIKKESIANNISLKKGGVLDLSVDIYWESPEYKELNILPSKTLEDNNSYVLTIDNNIISDKDYFMIDDWQIRFTALNDYVSPFIVMVNPEDDALNVKSTQKITVTFSELMDKETLGTNSNNGAFIFKDGKNNIISGETIWNINNLIFIPSSPLKTLEIFTIEISSAATDLAGNYLTNGYKGNFIVSGKYLLKKKLDFSGVYLLALNNKNQFYAINKNYKLGMFELNGTPLGYIDADVSDLGGISFDSDNNYYYTEKITGVIKKYDPNGLYYGFFGKAQSETYGFHVQYNDWPPVTGDDNGAFNTPKGIAIDDLDNLYIVDSGNNRIQKLDKNGNFILGFGTYGTGDSQFISPTGITIDKRNGAIYIADTGNNRIQKFDSNCSFINKWGESGSSLSQFNNPSYIAVDSKGYVFVSDSGNNRVQVFNGDGIYISSFGLFGDGEEYLNNPQGITVDIYGDAYVCDVNGNAIKVFTLISM